MKCIAARKVADTKMASDQAEIELKAETRAMLTQLKAALALVDVQATLRYDTPTLNDRN